jgi:CRISPR-associated protein Cmr3
LTKEAMSLRALGHNGPAHEARTHVSVQPETSTAAEGALFQTRGLEFTHHEQSGQLSATKRLALAVSTDATGIKPGLAPLGGERRIVHWREGAGDTAKLPECPPALVDKISKAGACRLVLLTPAHFASGLCPELQTLTKAGVTPELKAVASPHAQVVSGWDFEIKKPKPTRRLVPMGAVFFLKLDGDEKERREWTEQLWMQCISDNEQDRLDGFGLAVLGAWSGECPALEVTK